MERLEMNPLVDVSAPRAIPKVVAHRGARSEAPENTLPAIARAIELGAGGIEFDVLLTQDKVPVVTHDDDLSVLTHYRGYAHTTPFATVRSLDAGAHKSAAMSGVTMPTLAEALEAIERHDVLTIVEIKAQPGMHASAAELIGGIVGDFRMRGPVVISSASVRIIRELRRRHPKIERAAIVKGRISSFLASALLSRAEKLSGVHASLEALTPGLMQRCRQRGLHVHAWTANTADEIDHCMALGVDGIITDDVALARRHLEEKFGSAGR